MCELSYIYRMTRFLHFTRFNFYDLEFKIFMLLYLIIYIFPAIMGVAGLLKEGR